MARIRETLPGSTWTEDFSAKRIASQLVGDANTRKTAAEIVSARLQQRIAANAPVDTGELEGSVRTRIVVNGSNPRVEVKTVVHGAYQEHGTNLLPPTHFISDIVKSDRATWEADLKATTARLNKQAEAAEKKAKGKGRSR